MSKKNLRPKLSKVLKEFRTRYELTQFGAARWLYLPIGTYRDYEQGRSVPSRIIEAGIYARIGIPIAAYGPEYEAYLRQQGHAEERALESTAA